MSSTSAGIASIGLQLPPLFMPVTQLAELRGVDPNKYTKGLGCTDIALCPNGHDAATLAVGAAKRALSRWKGSVSDIGLVAVGTESAKDMSRPLSAWVAEELGLSGVIRSYEVKHACYGGTLALRQALEWKWSGAGAGKAALVIASDVALYALGDPGEPTQGAGAVAMIIDEPLVASVSPTSFPFSSPAFDFWRPVGDSFPSVDGQLSLDCYKRAVIECFSALIGDRNARSMLTEYHAHCFHVPFPKMVKKAVLHLGAELGWSLEETEAFYQRKVEGTLEWNQLTGNAYTASLWISVARALVGLKQGTPITAFSYGSGYGAELLELAAGPAAASAAWASDVEKDLSQRKPVDGVGYQRLRGHALAS
ncbi:MAG: hydroxymethylglutaryl-CoA synthase [Myxococcales bacterium]|nr:hydroxymethylglutaryl-CoA synthase [Myxococcales bacterium]